MTPQRQRPQLQAKMSFTSLLFLLFIPSISSFTSHHPPLSSIPLYSASFTADAQETPSDAAAADSTYFQIPSNPTLPHRSTSQRITLTRYLSNVVKEHPEVSSSTVKLVSSMNFMHPYISFFHNIVARFGIPLAKCSNGLQNHFQFSQSCRLGLWLSK
jgi:hypothetical protein